MKQNAPRTVSSHVTFAEVYRRCYMFAQAAAEYRAAAEQLRRRSEEDSADEMWLEACEMDAAAERDLGRWFAGQHIA